MQSLRAVHVMADLQGFTLGVQIHGLPDLIAMSYHHGELAQRVAHFDQEAHALQQPGNRCYRCRAA